MKKAVGKGENVENLQKTIEQLERDVKNYDCMVNLLTKYMATVQLPAYNQNRCNNYMIAMRVFSQGIIGNSMAQQDTWQQFQHLVVSYESNTHKNVTFGDLQNE